jgi:hypothetical protein
LGFGALLQKIHFPASFPPHLESLTIHSPERITQKTIPPLPSSLNTLELRNVELDFGPDFQYPPRLTALTLHALESLDHLSKLPAGLTKLKLDQLTISAADFLSSLPRQLQRLTVYDPDLELKALDGEISMPPLLQKLHFPSLRIDELAVSSFGLPSLTSLDLRELNSSISRFPKCPSLKKVQMESTTPLHLTWLSSNSQKLSMFYAERSHRPPASVASSAIELEFNPTKALQVRTMKCNTIDHNIFPDRWSEHGDRTQARIHWVAMWNQALSFGEEGPEGHVFKIWSVS